MANFIKLQTNIPVVGVVKYVDFAPSTKEGYSDQIAVRGVWDGEEGEPRIYLPFAVEPRFRELGIIGDKQPNGNYALKIPGAKIKITKSEAGKKHLTTIELLNGTHTSAQAAGVASSGPSRGTQATVTPGRFDQYTATMRRCYVEADKLLTGFGYEPDVHEIQSCAHSLFIQSARDNNWQSVGQGSQETFASDGQKLEACGLFEKLKMSMDAAKSEIKDKFGFDSIDKLTEGNAAALIDTLKSRLCQQPAF